MRNLLLFFHLAGAIVWMGGMAFMLLALRPAAAALLPPAQRLPLMADAMRRFFVLVGISIAALLLTGAALMTAAAGLGMPRGWHAMAAIGVVMMVLFAYLVGLPWRRMRRAVAASDWPQGASHMARIGAVVRLNFALGWIAIGAVLFWR